MVPHRELEMTLSDAFVCLQLLSIFGWSRSYDENDVLFIIVFQSHFVGYSVNTLTLYPPDSVLSHTPSKSFVCEEKTKILSNTL